jgi:hypothetical protein
MGEEELKDAMVLVFANKQARSQSSPFLSRWSRVTSSTSSDETPNPCLLTFFRIGSAEFPRCERSERAAGSCRVQGPRVPHPGVMLIRC